MSRERKRVEVEAITQRNSELEQLLLNAQNANFMLIQDLNILRSHSGFIIHTSLAFDSGYEKNSTFSPKILEHGMTLNAMVTPTSICPTFLTVTGPTLATEAVACPAKTILSPYLTQDPTSLTSDPTSFTINSGSGLPPDDIPASSYPALGPNFDLLTYSAEIL